MDVTPELIEIANNARREAMARTTIRKIEYHGTSAFWQIIVNPEPPTLDLRDPVASYASEFLVEQFPHEKAARNAFDRIIMRAVLDAVANHLVKGQDQNPSQAA